MVTVLTDGDKLPGFVSFELRERSPFGTLTVYLSCAEMAQPLTTASTPVIAGTIVGILLPFIASTSGI